jgi:MbtH protein
MDVDLPAATTRTDPGPQWTVLRNDEDQYALYPAELAVPAGWHAAGCTGTQEECAGYVDQHWTDMRPRSVRAAAGD